MKSQRQCVCAAVLGLCAAMFVGAGQAALASPPVIVEAWSYGSHGTPVNADLGVNVTEGNETDGRMLTAGIGQRLYLRVTFDQAMYDGAVSVDPSIAGAWAIADGGNVVEVSFSMSMPMDETCYLVDLAGSVGAGGAADADASFCVCYNEADVDGDGVVGTHDLVVIDSDMGKRADEASTPASDVDRSGTVTTADRSVVLASANWGHSPTPCPFIDCNDNQIPDGDEIAGGTAADCNHNGIPDECDIDSGPSDDVFPEFPIGDGIPDECCLGQPSPDFNGDTDVDLIDFSVLVRCAGEVAGPSGVVFQEEAICPRCECGCFDFNADGVVDALDVSQFVQEITGPL